MNRLTVEEIESRPEVIDKRAEYEKQVLELRDAEKSRYMEQLESIAIGARKPGSVGYDRPEPPGADLLGDLRVIATNSFFPPEGGELVVQKRKNGEVVFIIVERETTETVREHRATLSPELQMKLMNLLHAPVAGKPENPPIAEPPVEDWQIPGWVWAVFVSGVLFVCVIVFASIRKGAL